MFRQLLKLNCVTITILFWAFCFINSSLGQNRKKSITTVEKANSDSLTIPEKDTVIVKTGTKPSYRWQDRYLNRYSARVPQSPFYLKDPKNISNDFNLSQVAKMKMSFCISQEICQYLLIKIDFISWGSLFVSESNDYV